MANELEALSLDELRQRRDDVRERGESLSYRRRLLHAQLDLVEAAATAGDQEEFDAMIAETLSDGPDGGGTDVRAVEVEGRPEDGDVTPLPDDLVGLSDEERASLRGRLQAEERQVSAERRDLLEELDALQAELVRRFRRDGVDARHLIGEGN